ncbi:MAG: hypothetical protein AB1589_16565 [Cyanobacteriota bacterium]
MNRKSFALVSGVVLAATSFAIPSSANSVDIHQISTQDTPQLLAQGRGKGRDKDKDRGRGRDRNRERTSPNSSPCPTTPCPNSGSNTQVTLSNGFRITYLGMAPGNGTTTWRYRVEELPSAKDLSNWVLGLPGCARVVSASPKGEVVNPDPNAQISGIKWQTGAGFAQGEFTVTLSGQVTTGVVNVAAKGPDVVRGAIAGPSCTLR